MWHDDEQFEGSLILNPPWGCLKWYVRGVNHFHIVYGNYLQILTNLWKQTKCLMSKLLDLAKQFCSCQISLQLYLTSLHIHEQIYWLLINKRNICLHKLMFVCYKCLWVYTRYARFYSSCENDILNPRRGQSLEFSFHIVSTQKPFTKNTSAFLSYHYAIDHAIDVITKFFYY